MSLLLIDTRVRDYGVLHDAAMPGVSVVLFDSATDTLSAITARIAALDVSTFANVGIIQEGSNRSSSYSLVETNHCSLYDPDLATWKETLQFFTNLKSYSVKVIDFISCLIYSNPGWVSTIAALEARLGINFRASSDFTGNLSAGGNWIQESDGVNIQDIYFTTDITTYFTTE